MTKTHTSVPILVEIKLASEPVPGYVLVIDGIETAGGTDLFTILGALQFELLQLTDCTIRFKVDLFTYLP